MQIIKNKTQHDCLKLGKFIYRNNNPVSENKEFCLKGVSLTQRKSH